MRRSHNGNLPIEARGCLSVSAIFFCDAILCVPALYSLVALSCISALKEITSEVTFDDPDLSHAADDAPTPAC